MHAIMKWRWPVNRGSGGGGPSPRAGAIFMIPVNDAYRVRSGAARRRPGMDDDGYERLRRAQAPGDRELAHGHG